MSHSTPRRNPHRTPSTGRRTLLAMTLAAGVLSAAPHHARAAAEIEDDEHYDARVQGYTPDVEAKSSSVLTTWVLAILLAGGCMGVMFMNPKRSHLD